MIELRLHPGQLGLQRGALVDETSLEDGQRRGHGILINRSRAGRRGAGEPLGKLGEGAVEGLDGLVDRRGMGAGDERLKRLGGDLP